MNYLNGYGNYGSQTNLNWVQGEASARSWMIAPNSTVLLMDSDEKRFYIKSADASGMPSLRVFEYNEVTQARNTAPIEVPVDYVKKEDLEPILAKIDALESKIKPTRRTKDAEPDD